MQQHNKENMRQVATKAVTNAGASVDLEQYWGPGFEVIGDK